MDVGNGDLGALNIQQPTADWPDYVGPIDVGPTVSQARQQGLSTDYTAPSTPKKKTVKKSTSTAKPKSADTRLSDTLRSSFFDTMNQPSGKSVFQNPWFMIGATGAAFILLRHLKVI